MKHNGNKFSVYESEEKSVLGLLDELGSYVNHNTDELKNKTDLYGDHLGSWQGLTKPTLSDEGLKATVEDINNKKIPTINKALLEKANTSDVALKGFININDFDESTRNKILGLQDGEINAVLGDLNVKTHNIGYNQITADKIAFGSLGKNKFANTYLFNTTLGGADSTFTVNNSSGGVCALVKVKSGTTYTITVKSGHDRFRIGESANYPSVGSTVNKIYFADESNKATLTANGGINYFIIYLSSSAQGFIEYDLQVEEGNVATSYTKPTLLLDYEQNTVPQSAIKKELIQFGYQVGIKLDVRLDDQSIYVPGENCIVITDSDRIMLKQGNYSYESIGANSVCVLANKKTLGIEYCKTSEIVGKTSDYIYLGVINKSTNQVDINGTFNLNGKEVYPFTGDVQAVSNNNFRYAIDINNSMYNVSTNTHLDNTTLLKDCNKVYAQYDNLMFKYPSYITKTLIGTEYTGLPIYRYDFKPLEPQNNPFKVKMPKVMVSANIHGNETLVMTNHIRFFTDLCENWRNDDNLCQLRFGVHFIVIPVVNPWGYNNNQRKNSRGVDLNRNFSEGWDSLTDSKYTDTSNINYKGSQPMSEKEVQFYDTITQTERPDIIIDCHNFNTFDEDGHVLWFGSNLMDVQKVLFDTANKLTGKIKKDYSYMPQDNSNLIMIKGATDGGVIKYCESLGIPSVIFEAVWKMKTSGQDTQKATTDGLGNLIFNLVKNVNNV